MELGMYRRSSKQLGNLWSRVSVLVLVLCVFAQPTAQIAQAEGSSSLTQSGRGFRANLEWRTSSYGDGMIKRRTLLKAYVQAGEYMLLGSSAVGVASAPNPAYRAPNRGDIRVYAPDSVTGPVGNEEFPVAPVYSCAQQRSATGNARQGRIDTRAKEVAGPGTISDPARATPGAVNPAGYVPCYFQAQTSGIYSIVFLGPAGDGLDDYTPPNGSIADNSANYDARQNTSVAAWDVTIRKDLTQAQNENGRLFSRYLAMFTGNNGRPVNAEVLVVTTDGYQYRVDVRGMDPNGFVLYGNQTGFLNSDGTPLYRDVLPDRSLDFQGQNQLKKLQGGVTLAPPQYPIFFEPPSDDTLRALGIPLNPVLPRLDAFSFSGPTGTNTTSLGAGGTFRFSSNVDGVFEIVVSRDGQNFDPSLPQNRVLRGIKTEGVNTAQWDGLDNNGQPFPTGNGYLAKMKINGGEFHFPFLDVENSLSGSPKILLLNPPDANGDGVRDARDCPPLVGGCGGSVYDDRGYRTANGTLVGTEINGPLCPGNVGNPPNPLYSGPLGFNSESDQRRFGFATGGNPDSVCRTDGGFGDKKGLDLWTYYPSNEVVTPFNIVSELAVDLTSFTASATAQGTQLRWTTSAERNTIGFHILRGTGEQADSVRITPALLPAQGANGGATYTWTDVQPIPGARYWLEEVEANGTRNIYGPATAATAAVSPQVWVPMVR